MQHLSLSLSLFFFPINTGKSLIKKMNEYKSFHKGSAHLKPQTKPKRGGQRWDWAPMKQQEKPKQPSGGTKQQS
jgi:hypothetical protein